jgi:tRNA pseudouridine13 synthase
MREAPPADQAIGQRFYLSETPGTGGTLREQPSDFRVEEIETIDPVAVSADEESYPHLLIRATLTEWDTNDFVQALSDQLDISRERVAWAGTKDKHAVTTQLFSIRKLQPTDIPTLSNVEINVVGRYGRRLHFGDLAGNRFRIRVQGANQRERVFDITRELACDTSADQSQSEPATIAIANSFGHQRFGSRRPVTHVVGRHAVAGEWRKAVLAYIGNPHPNEPPETQDARAIVERTATKANPDWQAALDAIPGYLRFERSIIHYLVEHEPTTPTEWRAALCVLPRNLQQLFVNAVQSVLFNRLISRRLSDDLPIETPVTGDRICFLDRDTPGTLYKPAVDRRQEVTDSRTEIMRKHCRRGRAFVIAPLFGTETTLADGIPGKIERSVLSEEGIECESFAGEGAFDSAGTYRAIMLRTQLSVEMNDPDSYTLSFALPSGSYATSVMREYLKVDPHQL